MTVQLIDDSDGEMAAAMWADEDDYTHAILYQAWQMWPDVADRIRLRHISFSERLMPGHSVAVIDIAHLCRDGRCHSCGHGLGRGPVVSYHGTKSAATAASIIGGEGVMWDAGPPPRSLRGKPGWYHSLDFETARLYAHPTRVGPFICRIVFVIAVDCCHTANSQLYTKSGCPRYHVCQVLLVPNCDDWFVY